MCVCVCCFIVRCRREACCGARRHSRASRSAEAVGDGGRDVRRAQMRRYIRFARTVRPEMTLAAERLLVGAASLSVVGRACDARARRSTTTVDCDRPTSRRAAKRRTASLCASSSRSFVCVRRVADGAWPTARPTARGRRRRGGVTAAAADRRYDRSKSLKVGGAAPRVARAHDPPGEPRCRPGADVALRLGAPLFVALVGGATQTSASSFSSCSTSATNWYRGFSDRLVSRVADSSHPQTDTNIAEHIVHTHMVCVCVCVCCLLYTSPSPRD